jgi:DNA-binding response OmpR family regulator
LHTAGKLRILLVDDEHDITSVLKIGLERAGFSVDTFNQPTQALSSFKARHYDIIILDIRMPGMDGFTLARQIWSRDAEARVCFLTAFEIYADEARRVFPNFKTYCFVKKPIAPSALVAHVQSHFAKN